MLINVTIHVYIFLMVCVKTLTVIFNVPVVATYNEVTHFVQDKKSLK